jgi:carboxyl-terminal processing protease
MTLTPQRKPSLWARLILVPITVGLISASLIVGYASGELWPSHPAHADSANGAAYRVQTAQNDSQDSSDRADRANSEETPRQPVDPLSTYNETLSLLKQNYYGAPIDSKKTRQLTYEAIRGMLGSLKDQFTSFLDPDEWSQMQATTKGDFEGIGAMLDQRDGVSVKVIRPIETSPAEKVGLKAEDIIVSVDGQSVKGRPINDVVRLIKGPRGTRVRLGVQRGKEIKEFVITRARVEPPVVQHWMEDDREKIGHIVLSEFNEKSVDQINAAYAALESQGMRALVFDLRYNPGGLLDTAVAVGSIFIPENANPDLKDNSVVIIREGGGQEKGLPLRPSEHIHKQVPLVLLVNDNSASASEIVAGAIKDYGVGTLIGERTFGKGRVQTLFPMDDRSALRLTTALYFPPKHYDINFLRDEDGNRIENTGGVKPDIEVKANPKWRGDFRDKANDNQLQAALTYLRARLENRSMAQAAELVNKGQAH